MLTPWVRILLFATVAITFAEWLFDVDRLLLAFTPVLAGRRPWTVFTYMFVHGSLLHLFFNMIGLFFFGPRLEFRLGSTNFVALYFVSGLFGAILSLWNFYTPIIGASGAVFGILFAFARYWPHERILIWGVLPVEARTLVLVLATISLLLGLRGGGGIAHFAHLGGFLGGYVFLKVMEWRSPARRFRRQATGAIRTAAGAGDLERWSTIKREGLHEINVREIDRLLEKADKHGPQSLTADERAYLDRMSP